MDEFIHSLSGIVSRFLGPDFLLSFFLKSSVIVLGTFLLQKTLHKFSFSLRHHIWVFSLASILAVPFFSSGNGLWHISLYQQPVPEIIPSSEDNQAQLAISDKHFYTTSKSNDVDPPSSENIGRTGKIPLIEWLDLVWLAGVIIMAMATAMEFLWLGIILLKTEKSTGFAERILYGGKEEFGITKRIKMSYSSQITIPFTYGQLLPVIILPDSAKFWNKSRLRTVILHELAHIKRQDYITNLLSNLVCILGWYNPLIWWGVLTKKIQCEKACDELVLLGNVSRKQYAEELLNVAEGIPFHPFRFSRISAHMANYSGLKSRIIAIFNTGKRKSMSKTGSIIMILSAAITVISLSSLRLYDNPPVREISVRPLDEIHSPQVEIRREAARNLKHDWGISIVDPVLIALKSETDPKTKELLIESIGKFGLNKTFYTIAENINENPEIRIAVIKSLAQISCLPSYLLIEDCLNDKDPEVRRTAQAMMNSVNIQKLKISIHQFSNALYTDEISRQWIANQLSRVKEHVIIDKLTALFESGNNKIINKVSSAWLEAARENNFNALRETIITNI